VTAEGWARVARLRISRRRAPRAQRRSVLRRRPSSSCSLRICSWSSR